MKIFWVTPKLVKIGQLFGHITWRSKYILLLLAK